MIFQRNKKFKSLIIDVGSKEVSLAIFEGVGHQRKLNKISSKEIDILKNKNDTDLLEYNILNTVDSLVSNVDFKDIEKVHVFLSAPWHLCVYKTLSFDLNRKQSLNDGLISSMINKDLPALYEGKEVVFKEPVGFVLDGYRVKNIEGKSPANLKINILEGYANTNLIKKIKDTLKYIEGGNVLFHSFNIPAFLLISERFKKDRFVSVDFSGEVIELSVIENDFIKENVSISLGLNDIYRLISEKLSKDISTSQSLFNMYLKKQVDKEVGSEIDKILREDYKSILYEKLKKNIFKESLGRSFFKNIFIYTDEEFREIIKDLFSSYFLEETILDINDIRVSTIRSSMFDGFVTVVGNNDIFTLCEGYYIDKLYSK